MKYILVFIAISFVGIVDGQTLGDSIWKYNIQDDPYPYPSTCAVWRGPYYESKRVVPDTVRYEWIAHDKIRLVSDDDTFTLSNPDSVKWKPYYQKKKKKHELVMDCGGGIMWDDGHAPTITSIGLGDTLSQKTTISGANSFQLTFDSGATSQQLVFPVEAKNHWITEPYQWWKKLLWVLLGAAISFFSIVMVGIFGESKNIDL